MSKTSNLKDALDKYKGGMANEFFSLKDDKDSAVIRFLYDIPKDFNEESLSLEELDCYPVHEIEMAGKRRMKLCTEDSTCTECNSGNQPMLKIFIQVHDTRDGKNKIWERGRKYIPTILGLIKKYGSLVERPFEIERMGKKGDTQTTYQVYPLDKDNKTLNDFAPRQNLLERFIINPEKPDKQAKSSTSSTGSRRASADSEVF